MSENLDLVRSMIAADIYKPAEWHDFFLMTGGGAAVLAGLVFVAMSIDRDVVTQTTHKYRAINMLTGFTAAFIICALVLMGGQSHRAVGTEWLAVATVAAVIYVRHYVRAAKEGGSKGVVRPDRLAGSVTCYVAEIVGAVVLILGDVAGLYVAAVGLIVYFAFLISGAWLLLVAVHEDRSRQLFGEFKDEPNQGEISALPRHEEIGPD